MNPKDRTTKPAAKQKKVSPVCCDAEMCAHVGPLKCELCVVPALPLFVAFISFALIFAGSVLWMSQIWTFLERLWGAEEGAACDSLLSVWIREPFSEKLQGGANKCWWKRYRCLPYMRQTFAHNV